VVRRTGIYRRSAICDLYPLSLHGVGLSIGADRPPDMDHLARLKMLIARYEPALFSEHLAWSSHDVGFLNDLLRLPYTARTLTRVADHVDEVQAALGRQMLLENPLTYLAFAEYLVGDRFHCRGGTAYWLRSAARCQQCSCGIDQPAIRSVPLYRRLSARGRPGGSPRRTWAGSG
jgi:hypothetical protein